MTRLSLAAVFVLAASAASADMGMFLPDLTFPTAAPTPTVSTQGCQPLVSCPVSPVSQ